MGWAWSDINYWAVIAATIVRMALGFLWYSVLFQNEWMRLVGLKKESMKENQAVPMIGVLILSAGISLALAVLLQMMHTSTFIDGIYCGIVISLIVAISIAVNFIFDQRSRKLYWITVGYHTVSIFATTIILATWHKAVTMM
jgi:dipeptide/tripeptide permease